ncbi:TRAP transporter small permease [Cognatiyoonia sp. IB215182]|uniref:TRAP transporter small permease n=1 Tax=Cognatiyoonia sp. IB215182 TaxID=3097353 RepID=UPI002A0F3FBA|nr:TRAP transporter small permease [Cognatiyoonia sp. IB215182]MDX8354007.1 TRAP transporter small permease [Cognatiyoonia sp. IB215182]
MERSKACSAALTPEQTEAMKVAAKQLLIRLIHGWALLGGALLILIVLITAVNAAGFTANAIARIWGENVSGLPGYEDAVQMIVGVAAMMMFPYAQLYRAHAAVDVVMQYAPLWANRVVAILSGIALATLLVWMAWMLAQGTLQVRADRIETTVLGWPVWIFMPFAVISCLLWAAAAILDVITPVEIPDGA